MISGCIGPQDDGYNPAEILSAAAAQEYHSTQIGTFAHTAADMVTAITMTYVEEALGVTRAAIAAGHAGRDLVHGRDRRPPARAASRWARRSSRSTTETDRGPAYYMINCAHPTHFDGVLDGDGAWRERIRGLRANASTMSHAELDEATELDDGDPADLGARYAALAREAARAQRARRLLRHRPPPRRRGLPRPGRHIRTPRHERRERHG